MPRKKSTKKMENALIASSHQNDVAMPLTTGTSRQMSTPEQEIKQGKGVSPRKTELKYIEAHINRDLDRKGVRAPRGISNMRYHIIQEVLDLLDLQYEEEQVPKCPSCKKQLKAHCESCGEVFPVIKGVNGKMLDNKTKVALKLLDKIAPNLANLTQEVNVNITVQKVATAATDIILDYIPQDKQDEAIKRFQECILKGEITDAEVIE